MKPRIFHGWAPTLHEEWVGTMENWRMAGHCCLWLLDLHFGEDPR